MKGGKGRGIEGNGEEEKWGKGKGGSGRKENGYDKGKQEEEKD